VALNVSMGLGQFIVVRVTEDGKNYIAWVVDPSAVHTHFANGLPVPPRESEANKTTSASTLATNIQNALPTLAT
jgi:hypothetical protein